jgi:plasmid stabilization system protein ParE
MKVHYTTLAEQDLHLIASYTVKVWGEEQRARYMTFLETVCEQLLPNYHRQISLPYAGREGVRRYLADSHVIYFREVSDGLEILHIRHVSRAPW